MILILKPISILKQTAVNNIDNNSNNNNNNNNHIKMLAKSLLNPQRFVNHLPRVGDTFNKSIINLNNSRFYTNAVKIAADSEGPEIIVRRPSRKFYYQPQL